MYNFNAERPPLAAQNKMNVHFICICVILLLLTGIVVLSSSSYAFADRFYGDGNYFLIRQIKYAAAGMFFFAAFSLVDLEKLRKFTLPLVGAAVFLCVLTKFSSIGIERQGASRWIEIGDFSYQPSEMVKFVLPLYLAHLIDKKADKLNNFYSGILPLVIVTGVFFGIIAMQNNFSTAVFIFFNALVIFYLAGIRFRYFVAAVAVLIPVSILLVFTKDHRVRRLISFFRPDWEPQGAGYQVKSSLEAIASGGFLGKGIGEGTWKIADIPEVHSDFIFSAFAEETGFIGVLLFFAMFAVFAVFGYRAALKAETVFRRLLAASLTTMIVSQALLNVAVVSGVLPTTGIPLPFFSAGGSSLLTTLICSGVIVNIAGNKGCAQNISEVENDA